MIYHRIKTQRINHCSDLRRCILNKEDHSKLKTYYIILTATISNFLFCFFSALEFEMKIVCSSLFKRKNQIR